MKAWTVALVLVALVLLLALGILLVRELFYRTLSLDPARRRRAEDR